MTEPFFITYANNSFIESPEKIKNVMGKARDLMPILPFIENIDEPYDTLSDLYIATMKNDEEAISLIREKLSPVFPKLPRHKTEDDPFSIKDLSLAIKQWTHHNKRNLQNDLLRKRRILDAIASGKNYNEVKDLAYILNESRDVVLSFRCGEKMIIKEIGWHLRYSFIADFSLVLLLHSLFCYSLREFLLESKNYKKLKKCPHCQKYFIAKDKKRKICYETNCINEYHKRDMQQRREKDPVKYC